jgi:hypothetical protein
MAKLKIATPKPKRIPKDAAEIAQAYQAAEQESLEDAVKLRARRWRIRRSKAKTTSADS